MWLIICSVIGLVFYSLAKIAGDADDRFGGDS